MAILLTSKVKQANYKYYIDENGEKATKDGGTISADETGDYLVEAMDVDWHSYELNGQKLTNTQSLIEAINTSVSVPEIWADYDDEGEVTEP